MRFEPALKLALHEQFGKFLNGKKVFPIQVEVSPSGVCNANCDECFFKGERDDKLLDKRFLRVIDQMSALELKAVSWTGGGEPSSNPIFPQFVRRAGSVGLRQGLFTNALGKVKYDPSQFDWIRVSKTNRPWNTYNLKKLREGLTKGRALGMCINYKENDEVVKRALEVAREVGADYVQVRPAIKRKGEKTYCELPKIDDPLLIVTSYKFDDSHKDREYTLCTGFNFVPFIWQDGNMDVCSYQRNNPQYNLGNVYNSTLKEIFDRAPRELIVAPNCQVCCKNNEINTLVHRARNLQDKDFV